MGKIFFERQYGLLVRKLCRKRFEKRYFATKERYDRLSAIKFRWKKHYRNVISIVLLFREGYIRIVETLTDIAKL